MIASAAQARSSPPPTLIAICNATCIVSKRDARHNPAASSICRGVRQLGRNSAGDATATASDIAPPR